MRLAFVLYRYFPFGGLQRNMLAIAREAQQRGHRVVVYCTDWEGERDENIEVIEIPRRGWSNAARMTHFALALSKVLAGENFDLVVGFNKWPGLDIYYAADSCFAYKAYRERNFWYRLAPRSRAYLAFEAAVFGPESDTHILEVSIAERERFIAFYGTPAERFHTLPPGISRDRAAPETWLKARADKRAELGIGVDQKVLLALGSGFRTKGLDRSIAVLSALAPLNVCLLVVGDDNASAFEKQAEQLGVRDQVVFLGGRADVPEILQAGDVLLHPAYRENTGNVLLEAMIAGLPVITSEVCGYAHYVREAAMGAVLPEPFDNQAYAAAIKNALARDAAHWHDRGAHFARTSDIYHRPQVAVDAIEQRLSGQAGKQ